MNIAVLLELCDNVLNNTNINITDKEYKEDKESDENKSVCSNKSIHSNKSTHSDKSTYSENFINDNGSDIHENPISESSNGSDKERTERSE